VIVGTAGGGGWGDPADRDRGALAEDIANGKVSTEAAGRYGEAGPPAGEAP
jgi:N-methylhydantoinase B